MLLLVLNEMYFVSFICFNFITTFKKVVCHYKVEQNVKSIPKVPIKLKWFVRLLDMAYIPK